MRQAGTWGRTTPATAATAAASTRAACSAATSTGNGSRTPADASLAVYARLANRACSRRTHTLHLYCVMNKVKAGRRRTVRTSPYRGAVPVRRNKVPVCVCARLVIKTGMFVFVVVIRACFGLYVPQAYVQAECNNTGCITIYYIYYHVGRSGGGRIEFSTLLQNKPLFQVICPGNLWARDNR